MNQMVVLHVVAPALGKEKPKKTGSKTHPHGGPPRPTFFGAVAVNAQFATLGRLSHFDRSSCTWRKVVRSRSCIRRSVSSVTYSLGGLAGLASWCDRLAAAAAGETASEYHQ